MDGRCGGCCIARYGGGGGGASSYMPSKVDRIMLRFRPIAPKPAAGGSVTGSTSDANLTAIDTCGRRGSRAKRRCVRRRTCNKISKKRRAFSEGEKSDKSKVAVVTLPLLPESPDRKESPPSEKSPPSDLNLPYFPIWSGKSLPSVAAPQAVCPVGSWLTLECVMDTCLDAAGLISLGEEDLMMRSLEDDTCPGFITDGLDRVTWTNDAYRRMIGASTDGGTVVVGMILKENVPVTLRAFSCRIRVQYTCRKEWNSMTVPCDVWRMLNGRCFAWRLDIKAALSLGR